MQRGTHLAAAGWVARVGIGCSQGFKETLEDVAITGGSGVHLIGGALANLASCPVAGGGRRCVALWRASHGCGLDPVETGDEVRPPPPSVGRHGKDDSHGSGRESREEMGEGLHAPMAGRQGRKLACNVCVRV
jgi:hypothetical protein